MSVAGFIGTTTNIFAIGFLLAAFGWFIDILRKFTLTYNLPQYTLTTMYYIQLMFYAFGFLFFLAAIIHHFIVAKNESTGVV